MTGQIDDFERSCRLRNGAISRMTGTLARGSSSMSTSAALGVLHKLASSPATASEALALLHELQVYQVELEMQDEELRAARSEMETLLRRRQELYDHSPAALFTIDRQTQVVELNATATRLLGVQPSGAVGWRLNSFLSAEDGQQLDSV
jgi:PAS domain-containing protein